MLLKLESAWEVALELDRRQFWLALSGKAMEMMNVELAMRVYRQLGDAGMVMALQVNEIATNILFLLHSNPSLLYLLQECIYIEDKNLLAGKISMLFGDYNRAQDLYLASSRPSAALDMRRDLLQWDQALKLAQVLEFVHTFRAFVYIRMLLNVCILGAKCESHSGDLLAVRPTA